MDQNRSSTEPPVPAPSEEQAHAKKLLGEIDEVLESSEWKEYEKAIKKNREYAKGEQHSDKSGELVRANLVHAEVMSLVSTVYAKDPEISITPTEAVTADRYEQVKQMGKTMELVLNSQFMPSQANLKKNAKAAIRATATAFIGWVKVVYQKDYEQDPEIAHRIKDVQDDIERIEHLDKEIEREGAGESGTELDAQKQELTQMLTALESKPEVVRSEGLVIDKPLSEDMLFSLDVMDSIDISDAGWITQRVWMTVDKCVQKFKFCPSKSSRYASDRSKKDDKTEKVHELVCVYEMWHEVNSTVYTLIDGYDGYLKPPFTPSKSGERFHGFFPLILDPVDGERIPLSLVGNLTEMQDEHNETRTNYRHHRKHNLPVMIGIEGKVSQKDADKVKNAESWEVVLIEGGNEGERIEDYLHQFVNPSIDPNVYTTDHIRQDWEQVTRRGDAARGSVATAKTATEANILQQGLATSSSEAQDTVEEWLREIAQYSAEVLLQEMSFEQVQRIAGEEAVWPEMTKDEVFDIVTLDIRAGSSGKPDKSREQEQWIKFLPELRDSLMAINEMEATGAGDRAEILRKLVEETLRRFDERIDIDEYFPKSEDEGQDQTQQIMQQLQQAQQELEQLKESKQAEQEANQLDAKVRVQEAQRRLEESAFKKEAAAIKGRSEIASAQGQGEQLQVDAKIKQLELQIKQEELRLKESEMQYKAAECGSRLDEAKIKQTTMYAKSESDLALANKKAENDEKAQVEKQSEQKKEEKQPDVSKAIEKIANEVKSIKETADAANEQKSKSISLVVNGKTYLAKVDKNGAVQMKAGGKTYRGKVKEGS
jgi:hypothetical protein